MTWLALAGLIVGVVAGIFIERWRRSRWVRLDYPEANARLIAKAPLLPELVEALRAMLARYGERLCDSEACGCTEGKARAALARYDEAGT